jgi:hypothetical protein
MAQDAHGSPFKACVGAEAAGLARVGAGPHAGGCHGRCQQPGPRAAPQPRAAARRRRDRGPGLFLRGGTERAGLCRQGDGRGRGRPRGARPPAVLRSGRQPLGPRLLRLLPRPGARLRRPAPPERRRRSLDDPPARLDARRLPAVARHALGRRVRDDPEPGDRAPRVGAGVPARGEPAAQGPRRQAHRQPSAQPLRHPCAPEQRVRRRARRQARTLRRVGQGRVPRRGADDGAHRGGDRRLRADDPLDAGRLRPLRRRRHRRDVRERAPGARALRRGARAARSATSPRARIPRSPTTRSTTRA